MVYLKHIAPALLGFAVTTVHAGSCFSSIRDPDSDPATPVEDPWAECPNDAPEGGWACQQEDIAFPTLDCIKADLISCGTINSGPTVFYSLGATTKEVREGLRDKLDPRGVMFNDALGASWWKVINEDRPDFNLNGNQARQDYFRNLFAIAMAQVSEGEVFLVTRSRKSEADDPGDDGIWQNPKGFPNIWREMELPNLQRNENIEKITNAPIDADFELTTDWNKGDDVRFDLPDIDPNNPPEANQKRRRQQRQRLRRDDDDECPMPDLP